MKNLTDLYKSHAGKVSDKWSLYLREYDRLFAPYREQNLSMLEIGIQNGGSLEIWSQYFVNAQNFIGCDIDPACAKLQYEDPRITVVVGDATTFETRAKILEKSATFDLIIEDGSHASSDIVKAFSRYFAVLNNGGLFVVEDLHCSYWQEYEGGIFHPYSSITFFKHLADMVNHEHWGLRKSRLELVKGFEKEYNIEFDEDQLAQISSVEFVNSICVVRKKEISENCLGSRIIAGRELGVMPSISTLDGAKAEPISQTYNPWSILTRSPVESYLDNICEIQHNKNLISKERAHLNDLRNSIEDKKVEIEQLNEFIKSIKASKSWRYTRPFRLIAQKIRSVTLVAKRYNITSIRAGLISALKVIYWATPPMLRTKILYWFYRNIPCFFNGIPHYELWRANKKSYIAKSDESIVILDNIKSISRSCGSIGVHMHIYYADLADEFSNYLNNIPFAYDLYVSVSNADGEQRCRTAFANLTNCRTITIKIVENRGRDIAPMFCTFGSSLKEYDFIAHLHSKKSLYNYGATEGWREYLTRNLLGSSTKVRKILTLLTSGKGIVYPQNYHLLPYMANTWLANKSMGIEWCSRLAINPIPQGYFDFPAGSMFWARSDALLPLFNAGITIDDFAEEAGQTDGTFAHCLERLLALSTRKQGLQVGIIKDLENQSWSSWRIDQSVGRSFQSLVDQFSNSCIKCVAFDIFDTLLIRPLINADSTKTIVAANLPERLANLFNEYRVTAENEARKNNEKDVSLREIYESFQLLTRLSDEDVATICELEAKIEYSSLSVRKGGLELFEYAKATGKPVILISDMFLPVDLIIRALQSNGVNNWSKIYVSNEIGLRKDSGKLYDYILNVHKLKPAELLMIGDNERSDFQIPCDKKIIGLHILRPTELARGMPRLRPILEEYEHSGELNAELQLGQVFAQNFSAVVYPEIEYSSLFNPDAYNIGYSLVGPLLTSMAQWLVNNANNDNVHTLYFLSREGKIIKDVYDLWTEGKIKSPISKYLVVSRRACSVPLIKTLDDICNIAKTDYFANKTSNFLLERFGVELSLERWDSLYKEIGIGNDTLCEIHDENLGQIMPLLERVANEIFQSASEERLHLMDYLTSTGLMDDRISAVVDVGYGASIQNYLCELTNKKLHGYYLATDERASKVMEKHDVFTRGCFVENAEKNMSADIIYLKSFELEKLLSANDGQIIKYKSSATNTLEAIYRSLSDKELSSEVFRTDLHNGVMQFVKDAIQIREKLLSSYSPSIKLSKALISEFLSSKSDREAEIISEIFIDDHYCGRGIV